MEEILQTMLCCAVRQIDGGKKEISIFLKVPLYLAWLTSSWGPVNSDSQVGVFYDCENMQLPNNTKLQVTVQEFEEAITSVLYMNKITKKESEQQPKILAYGHLDETRKLRENITKNIIFQRTLQGKNDADFQIKKGVFAWALTKKWKRTWSNFKLFNRDKSEQWVVLISGDHGNKMTMQYMKKIGFRFMLICETLPGNMQ